MTPAQKARHLVLIRHEEFGDDPETIEFATALTPEAVDEQFAALADNNEHWDAMNEVREGQFETELPCDYSRNYESKAVAAKYLDGSYVGWTYWYGGGKHSDPESIEWIDEAYDVDCVEEEKLVVVRTFSVPAPIPA